MPPQESTNHAVAAEHSHHAGHSAYQSNPFIATIDGLINLLKVNPVASLLTGVVFVLTVIAAVLVDVLLNQASPLLAALVLIAGLIVAIPILYGAMTVLAIASLRGESVTVKEVYNRSFSKLISSLVVLVLVILAIGIPVLIAAVIGAAANSPVLTAILTIVAIIATVVVFGSWFSLSFMVLFDDNVGPVAAMKRSRELVQGHIVEMIGAIFAAGLMSGYGGGLLSPAVSISPLAGRYQQLKALKASGAAKPKVHWLNYLVFILLALYLILVVVLVVVSAHQAKTSTDPFNNGTYNFPSLNNNSNSSTNYFTN